ncbi:MAG: hypothetical protein ACR2HS_04920 [Gammaproteobacteria bacterium]
MQEKLQQLSNCLFNIKQQIQLFISMQNLTDEPVIWANGYIRDKNLWSKRILKLHLKETDALLASIVNLSLCSDLKLAKINNFWLKQ